MTTKKNNKKSKVKVLYQNLGGVWYAFADMGQEVFFGKVPVALKAPKTNKKIKAPEVAPSEASRK